MLAEDTMPIEDKPMMLNDAWTHSQTKLARDHSKGLWWHEKGGYEGKRQESLIPSNYRCIEKDGYLKLSTMLYSACLVACGYSWVLYVDFLKFFSPVVNDITCYILLLMVIHFGYLAKK